MVGMVEEVPIENGQEMVGRDTVIQKIDITMTAADTRVMTDTEMALTVTVTLVIDTETVMTVTMTPVIGRETLMIVTMTLVIDTETTANGWMMMLTHHVLVLIVEIEMWIRLSRVARDDSSLTTLAEVGYISHSPSLLCSFVLQRNGNRERYILWASMQL